jgi:hypothetical protein
MNSKRVSIGFDLRVNPELQEKYFWNQHLVPELASPISADPCVWVEMEEFDSLEEEIAQGFLNPLTFAKNIDVLIDAYNKLGFSTNGLWPACFTSSEANVIELVARFGPGWFENQPTEEELQSRGWQLMGFDVVDLFRLSSGLKGCGYTEPTWSQLRGYFSGALNEVGLFSDCIVASQFAEVRGLQLPAHAPFIVVGILVQRQM